MTPCCPVCGSELGVNGGCAFIVSGLTYGLVIRCGEGEERPVDLSLLSDETAAALGIGWILARCWQQTDPLAGADDARAHAALHAREVASRNPGRAS